MRSVRICVLSSGSGGNCLFVETGGRGILIDAGLPLRETIRRMRERGLDPRCVHDVFLTHEHSDHCAGAGVLSRKLGVTVHATRGTLMNLRDQPRCVSALEPNQPVQIGPLRVTPIPVPHDAREPVAYVFEDEIHRGAVVTDLGCAPRHLVQALQNLDALVLEMNHDPRLLMEGPYPQSLKRRISSDWGHLSNQQGAQLLNSVLHGGLKLIVLAHLSEHNNTEKHALMAAETVLMKHGSAARLLVASQVRPLDSMLLSEFRAAPLRRARQLALFA